MARLLIPGRWSHDQATAIPESHFYHQRPPRRSLWSEREIEVFVAIVTMALIAAGVRSLC
jgi:hypothetical protein